MKYFIILISLIFSLTSCIELLDDVSINSDGSGNFKYTINLSSSRSKINSILALDSIDGQKVPDKKEIEEKIKYFKTEFSKETGITNVSIDYNLNDYLIKFSCDFDNVKNLQSAFENTFQKVFSVKSTQGQSWLVWNGNGLERNIPDIAVDRFQNSNWLDFELLQTGSYTSISRFQKPVESFTNSLSMLSKNKLAVMTKVTTDEIFENPQILKNKISLEGQK